MASFNLASSKWGSSVLGTGGGQVTWSFALTSAPNGYQFDRILSEPEYQALIRDAFQAWEDIANIDFVEVADSASSEMRLGWDAIDGPFGTVGQANWQARSDGSYDASAPRFSINSAEIRFDTAEDWTTAKTPQANKVEFFSVALHEIGHAIGLQHTDDTSTIMFPTNSGLSALAAGDITGAQTLYGPAANTTPAPASVAASFAASPDVAKGLAAAYQTLLGGVPNQAGFTTLIKSAVDSNFGAGPGPIFNIENIFINLANNLVQGNTTASATFANLASGATLSAKIGSLYAAIIPAANQSAEGLAFLTGSQQLAFYQAVAAERGVAGTDGAAVVAMAALLNIAVKQDIGVGDDINDLVAAVAAGSAQIPTGGSVFTDIEIADGTAFDADDGDAVSRVSEMLLASDTAETEFYLNEGAGDFPVVTFAGLASTNVLADGTLV